MWTGDGRCGCPRPYRISRDPRPVDDRWQIWTWESTGYELLVRVASFERAVKLTSSLIVLFQHLARLRS